MGLVIACAFGRRRHNATFLRRRIAEGRKRLCCVLRGGAGSEAQRRRRAWAVNVAGRSRGSFVNTDVWVDSGQLGEADRLLRGEVEEAADAPRLRADEVHGAPDKARGHHRDLGLHEHPRGGEEAAEGGEHADAKASEDEVALG